jgi:hypothetical protein
MRVLARTASILGELEAAVRGELGADRIGAVLCAGPAAEDPERPSAHM